MDVPRGRENADGAGTSDGDGVVVSPLAAGDAGNSDRTRSRDDASVHSFHSALDSRDSDDDDDSYYSANQLDEWMWTVAQWP